MNTKHCPLPCLVVAMCVLPLLVAKSQPVVNIAVVDGYAAETWPGQTADMGLVRLTRTGSTASSLTVITRFRGTATEGMDFTSSPNAGASVTIPAGQTSADVTIIPLDDIAVEATESARLEIRPPAAGAPYVVGTNDRAAVDISDNDDANTPPQAIVSVATIQNAAEGTNGSPATGTFRFSRTQNTSVALTVAYSVSGSATAGDDFDALSGIVMIPANVLSADVTLTPVDDAVLDPNENVVVTVAPSSCPGIFPPPPECYVIGSPASATMTIADNEIPPPPPTIVITSPPSNGVATAGQPLTVTFTATDVNGHITSYHISGGSSSASGVNTNNLPIAPGTPFTASGTLTFPNAYATVLISVTVVDNDGVASTATRSVWVAPPTPPPPPPPPPPATFSITALDADAAETLPGEPPNTAKFLFTMTGTPGELEFFNYSFIGSARENIDYTISYGTPVTFTNGTTNILQQEITIMPVDDVLVEGDETVKMQMCFVIIAWIYGVGAPIGTSCTGDTIGLNATITIHDNDTSPPPYSIVSVTASDADASEVSALSGDTQNPGAFTITRTAPLTNDLVVKYSMSQPSSTALPGSAATRVAVNGVDYQTLNGQAMIPAGASSVIVPVQPVFDTIIEGNEIATLTLLRAGTNLPPDYILDPGVNNFAQVTIRDYAPTNIPIVSIATTDATAYEANVASRTASFVVKRTGAPADALTLTYATSGEASNGVDYVALPGSVTIPAGIFSAAIIVTPIADTVVEPAETVALTLLPPPADQFPPAYMFSSSASLKNSAGASIRDQLLPPSGLSKRQRIVWLRRHRHVIISVPQPVVTAAATLVTTTNAAAAAWFVDASNDLKTWEEIGLCNDPEEFVDVDAGDAPQRFYRFREIVPATP